MKFVFVPAFRWDSPVSRLKLKLVEMLRQPIVGEGGVSLEMGDEDVKMKAGCKTANGTNITAAGSTVGPSFLSSVMTRGQNL